jgi:segregation and condensation protein B
MSEQSESLTISNFEKSLEALLFVASSSVPINQLAEALACKIQDVELGILKLEKSYNQGRGLRIQRHAGRIQLTTAPELAPVIEKFLGLEATARLSRAALEALAIVAYRQPITRPGIDAVRGVNSDGVIKSLHSKGLIEEVGRLDGPGRPILYGTTSDFLQHFGLSSINELPPFEKEDVPEVEETKLLKD